MRPYKMYDFVRPKVAEGIDKYDSWRVNVTCTDRLSLNFDRYEYDSQSESEKEKLNKHSTSYPN